MKVGTHSNQNGGIFIKTYSGNGGLIEDVTFDDIESFGSVHEWHMVPSAAIRVTMIYHTTRECEQPCPVAGCNCTVCGNHDPFTHCRKGEKAQLPRIRNLTFTNLVMHATQNWPSPVRESCGNLTAGVFYGLPESPIDGITIMNVTVNGGGLEIDTWNCTNVINVVTDAVSPPWRTGTCTRPPVPVAL
jgi:hypothetical protein